MNGPFPRTQQNGSDYSGFVTTNARYELPQVHWIRRNNGKTISADRRIRLGVCWYEDITFVFKTTCKWTVWPKKNFWILWLRKVVADGYPFGMWYHSVHFCESPKSGLTSKHAEGNFSLTYLPEHFIYLNQHPLSHAFETESAMTCEMYFNGLKG